MMAVLLRTFGVIISVTILWILYCKGAVTLTVEGGDSLVGPYCPGTVRLFCEGVRLTTLRWRYNGNNNIQSYFSDSTAPSTSKPSMPAFLSVELTAVYQDFTNVNLANFSSILTVNLSRLQSDSIADISCGDPVDIQNLPVNVSIIKPGTPNSPIISMVTATYHLGTLQSIEVQWTELATLCQSFSVSYEVQFNTSNSIETTESTCYGGICKAFFTNLAAKIGIEELLDISIKAVNRFGTSNLILYPNVIAQEFKWYFTPEVFSHENSLFGRCKANRNFVGSTMCTIQFTTDFMYRNLSDELIIPLDTDFLILSASSESTTYFILFSAYINNSLKITDRFEYKFSTQSGTGPLNVPVAVTIPLVIAVLTGFITVAFIIISLIWYKKKTTGGEAHPLTKANPQSTEKIDLLRFNTTHVHDGVASTSLDQESTKPLLYANLDENKPQSWWSN